ncbi:FeoB-associated Cys-rich membrane protein [Tautonia plasticadhaerens]|uniref:Virus attachment protein p12 family protein n=1 Tax=Tautonia plasticadhaerens TaxID=2527974 RepID=A0A518GV56_9BACT|nr:FeoB-associated Cys-rich membrane protein [Tautonia plasticadhaerens]QDV32456.1 hypothetical protein ElP_02880 [Tautonia plasticadhaerens]
MMTAWQDVAALAMVALALGYLARSGYRAVSTRGASGAGCGSGCGNCPSGSEAGANGRGEPLVMIDPPRISS